jgi:CxxC motif-containing protein
MLELTCIVCPVGCRILVEPAGDEVRISGQGCPKGETYARDEALAPKRVVTSVVTVVGRPGLLPVKTVAPILKEKIWAAMAEIREIRTEAPVKIGQVIREDLAGTGVGLVATKTIVA